MASLVSIQHYERSFTSPNFTNFDREYHVQHRIDLKLGTDAPIKEFYAFDDNSKMISLTANDCYFIELFATKEAFNYIYNHSNDKTRKMLSNPREAMKNESTIY